MLTSGSASEWAPVSCDIPQGSVLGLILFRIYINDVDVGFNNIISKFADDTKIGESVLTDEDRLSLQKDLHTTLAWSDRWKMLFNIEKCQVLQKDNKHNYEMCGVKFSSVQCAKDTAPNLEFSQQCNAAHKANRMLGFIKGNFSFKNKDVILPLFNNLVRRHLEYAVQF